MLSLLPSSCAFYKHRILSLMALQACRLQLSRDDDMTDSISRSMLDAATSSVKKEYGICMTIDVAWLPSVSLHMVQKRQRSPAWWMGDPIVVAPNAQPQTKNLRVAFRHWAMARGFMASKPLLRPLLRLGRHAVSGTETKYRSHLVTQACLEQQTTRVLWDDTITCVVSHSR